MEYFFLGETMYDVLLIIGFIILLAINGLFIYRINKVKIKSIEKKMAKFITVGLSIIIIGIVIWLSATYDIIGTIIIYGFLIIATRFLGPLATGLTDKGIQYTKQAPSGSGALTELIKIIQFVPYSDIKKMELEETDTLNLKVEFSIVKLTLHFPLESKEEVQSFLRKRKVL